MQTGVGQVTSQGSDASVCPDPNNPDYIWPTFDKGGAESITLDIQDGRLTVRDPAYNSGFDVASGPSSGGDFRVQGGYIFTGTIDSLPDSTHLGHGSGRWERHWGIGGTPCYPVYSITFDIALA